MSESPKPDIAADVVKACTASAAEAAEALSRALDAKLTLAVGAAGSYAPATPPEGFAGPGLVILLQIGAVGMAAAMPESCGLLPAWYSKPGPTDESKLSTLAKELGKLLVPDSLAVDACEARGVENLAESISRADAAVDAASIPLELAAGAKKGTLWLIWPMAAPGKLFASATSAAAQSPVGGPIPASQKSGPKKPVRLVDLPGYSRSLLRITVPVSVQLAAKKESVQEVMEIAPGSIIKFSKGCDELLQMFVGDQPLAEGEVVKIGEKFGFRVTSMLHPREHFLSARRQQAG